MTVAELRALLESFDQDLPVTMIDDGMMVDVTSADVEDKLWTTPDKPVVILW